MRAVQVVRLDGPAAVEVRDVPEPARSPQQVLVDVAAAGVNFPTSCRPKGLYQYRPELPFTLGSEVAGTVREAPDGSPLAPGDRVVAFTSTGAFAEVAASTPTHVLPLPDNVSFEAGAGLPMNYLTAHFALVVRGHLQAGQAVLVHGAAGGVGTACVQLAAALGATVIAVVSSDAKAEVARAAGAAHAVPVEGFRDAVKELGGVDLVVDPVGGDRFTDSLRCLRPLGRLLVIGFTAGEIPTVQGQPVAAQQHRRRGRRLGRLRARQARLRRGAVGRAAAAPPLGRARPADRGPASRWRRRRRRWPRSTSAGCSAKIVP